MKEGFRWCPHCREPHVLASRFCPGTGLPIEKQLHESSTGVGRHPLAGTVVDGRYEIRQRIGSGAMNEVFEAVDRGTNEGVGLKIVKQGSSEAAQRLEREARLLSALDHPNLCAARGTGAMPDGRPYLALERLEGETLATRLHGRARLHWSLAVSLFAQLLDGLAAAHVRGITHRDLKPSNVFLVDRGQRLPLVKLLDFGLAFDGRSRRMTRPGRTTGTPLYMSPEQLLGAPPTATSDLFAVGIMLYEALSGRHPFAAATMREQTQKTLFERETELAVHVPDALPEVRVLVHRALAKAPEERTPTASEMRDALLRIPTQDAEVDSESQRASHY